MDLIGQQAFGNTAHALSIPDPAAAFAAFGWEVATVHGHDEAALAAALDVTDRTGPPCVVLAETVFGRGVSYMERQLKWHYLPMDDDQYEGAMTELQGE